MTYSHGNAHAALLNACSRSLLRILKPVLSPPSREKRREHVDRRDRRRRRHLRLLLGGARAGVARVGGEPQLPGGVGAGRARRRAGGGHGRRVGRRRRRRGVGGGGVGRVPGGRPRRVRRAPGARGGADQAAVHAPDAGQGARRARPRRLRQRQRQRLRRAALRALLLQADVVRGVHLHRRQCLLRVPPGLARRRRRLPALLRCDGGVRQGDEGARSQGARHVLQGARAKRRPDRRRRGGAEVPRHDDIDHAPQHVPQVSGPGPRDRAGAAHGLGLLLVHPAEPRAGAPAAPPRARPVGDRAGGAGGARRRHRRPLPPPHQRPLPQRAAPGRRQPGPRARLRAFFSRAAERHEGGAAPGGDPARDQACVPRRHVAGVHGDEGEGVRYGCFGSGNAAGGGGRRRFRACPRDQLGLSRI